MNIKLNNSVVVFLDILGFKELLKIKKDFNNLFNIIKSFKESNTSGNNVEYHNTSTMSEMSAIPAITSFSDCIIMSIPLNDIKPPFDIGNAVNVLVVIIQQIADTLIKSGYILRGGITCGEIYHNDNMVFGKALVDAYELESTKARYPRILVSNKLANQYNKTKYDNCNFISKDNASKKSEYYLDYLKLSFEDPENRNIYINKTNEVIKNRKNILFKKIMNGKLNNLSEDIKCLEKWLYFQEKIKNTISQYS